MALKTLNANDKAAFQQAGVTLTPHGEHIAAEAKAALKIDWPTVIGVGVKIALAILAAFGVGIPAQASKKACAPGCCDHCDCCCKCIHKTLELLECELHHMCCCMDESNHCG